MGTHSRPVSTSNPDAQRYFNQGLIWTFGFNHDEAIRSFEAAARCDPNLAMAWWGVALCHGPHINNPVVPPERGRAAWEALSRAKSLREHASPVEQALIDALAQRYASPPPEDRSALDQAYAQAMRRVYDAYPNDADIAVLYAESLMDLQPWDLWTRQGEPKGAAPQIVAALENALKLHPDHPGACHLYIHAVEASSAPQRAVAAADRLRDLVPASGHLVHMPSHIDVRVGAWAQAAQTNERAMRADIAYRRISPRHGFYHIYMAHNPHFLAWVSMMEGRYEVALRAARDMIAGIPEAYAKDQAALVDPHMSIALEVQKRFGRWDEILAEPAPPAHLPITTAHWRYIRGVAYAARGDLDHARREQEAFRTVVAGIPDSAIYAINNARKVLSIADHFLAGELALREGRLEAAIAELRKGAAIEDELMYMEPPDWLQPVRHTLGAVLLQAGQFSEAESVYREDLAAWPENGWALHGLAAALRGQGKPAEAQVVQQRFEKAWARADTAIRSSCLCVAVGEQALRPAP